LLVENLLSLNVPEDLRIGTLAAEKDMADSYGGMEVVGVF
jgi:hypothetical protein